MMIDTINRQLNAHCETIEIVKDTLAGPIAVCAQMLADAFKEGSKVLIMGNGGSAADAQHFAAEMVGRFLMDRRALPVIAMTTDTSVLTSVGNDFGFDDVFRRQVDALAKSGDVLVAISTSGNSKNVIRALESGKSLGATTIGLLGHDGGKIASLVDLPLTVPCHDVPRIQEAHLVIIHLLCELIEKILFSNEVE